jgi:Flp pilus assembly protein CpaB
MSAPARPPRTRASGGRTLMLLGVLLALAAGTIVIYIVSTATGTGQSMVNVVVAKVDIPPNTVLVVGPTDASQNHLSISDAFAVKQVSQDFAPANAFPYVSQDDLNIKLNNQVVVQTIFAGDILHQVPGDPRLVSLGTGAPNSLANLNPGEFKAGDVLVTMNLNSDSEVGSKPLAAAGDTVDILVMECNLPNSKDTNGCEAQTTLQNVYVYTATPSQIVVVLTHQQALELMFLQQTGTRVEIALRKPGDSAPATTNPVDSSTIVKDFSF